MRSSCGVRRLIAPAVLVAWAIASPGPSVADEPGAAVRLPEIARAVPLRRAGEGLYLNINAKGGVYRTGMEKPDVLTGREAVKWVEAAGELTTRRARQREGAEAFVAVRADRDAPAAEVLELVRSCGVKSIEFRVLKPAAGADGLPTEARLPFARSEADPKKALAVGLADPKELGGKGAWHITRPGAEPEAVEPAKLGGRLKELLGKGQVAVLMAGKSWAWSPAVEALAACHEAGVKELALGR